MDAGTVTKAMELPIQLHDCFARISQGVEDGGEVIRPEHILQALYEEIGLTTEPDLRVAPLTAIFG